MPERENLNAPAWEDAKVDVVSNPTEVHAADGRLFHNAGTDEGWPLFELAEEHVDVFVEGLGRFVAVLRPPLARLCELRSSTSGDLDLRNG